MFSKATLISLVVGALYVNALAVPVARSPIPESECKFPGSFHAILYHRLTFAYSPRTRSPARSPDLWTDGRHPARVGRALLCVHESQAVVGSFFPLS